MVRYEWELAKELGINITVHVAMDRFGYTKMQLAGLRDMGLLYPNTTYIHSSHCIDDEWQLVADSGGNVSLAPQIEIQMGHGWAPAQTGRGATASRSGSQLGRGHDRLVRPVHPDARDLRVRARPRSTRRRGTRTSTGSTPTPDLITSRQVLALGDARRREGRRHRRPDGLDHAGQEGRPRDHRHARPSNVAPVIDPVGAVVCAADVSNVDTVLVDGKILKRDGKLVHELTGPAKAVEASRDYLVVDVRRTRAGLAARRR